MVDEGNREEVIPDVYICSFLFVAIDQDLAELIFCNAFRKNLENVTRVYQTDRIFLRE